MRSSEAAKAERAAQRKHAGRSAAKGRWRQVRSRNCSSEGRKSSGRPSAVERALHLIQDLRHACGLIGHPGEDVYLRPIRLALREQAAIRKPAIDQFALGRCEVEIQCIATNEQAVASL